MLIFAFAVASIFLPAGAGATMYGNVQQIRETLFQTFVVMGFGAAGFTALVAYVLYMQRVDEEMPAPSSVVVPPFKQESNIVQDIIHV
jgi:hypothetical protein